jgi:MFS family permease
MGTRWVILGVIFVARIVIGYQFQSIASIAPYLLKDLQVNYAQVGVLIGLYDLPGLVFAFSSGYFSRRFGDKVTCAIGLTLMALGGLLLGWAGSFTVAVAGRLISGAGSIVFELAMTKMVTDWFAGREIVLAMGIFLASWTLGVTVSLICQGL